MMETRDSVSRLHGYAQRAGWELRFDELGSYGPDHDKTFTVTAVLNGKVYGNGEGKNKKEAKQNAAEITLRYFLEKQRQNPAVSTENAAENLTASLYQTSISDTDYVSLLYEYGLRNKISIKPVESLRVGSNISFLCRFKVGDKDYPAASAKTKKEAKKEAAKLVCLTLGVKPRNRTTNFISFVIKYCEKTGRIYNFIEEKRCGPVHSPTFFYKLVINDKDYPVGEGKTITEARQNAAQLAWSALQEQSDWDSKVSFRSTVSEDSAPTMLPSPTMTLESPKTSSQIMARSTSESEIPTDSSTPPKTQVSLRSAVSVDSAPTRLSAPSSLESLEVSSQSMPTGTSDSVIFTDSSNPSKEQDVVKNKNMENRPSEMSSLSRFSSEFDSIECLARGGFGRVYKAREKLMDKCYAVKVVCSNRKALREVGALEEILHCNIVRYYNCWQEDSEYQWDSTADSCSSSQSNSNSSHKFLYIKMELCDTKTIKDWINEKNKETMPETKRREESLPIVQQIVSGVECIHSKKIIHRDLKPANIMFGLDGKVKIGDFGLAIAEADDDDENQTERTNKTGTKSYMAPEQRSNRYGHKVDIFALGLIYFELLWNLSTGHERGVILGKARSQTLPEEFSSKFPRENQIIMSMLCVKPEDRPEASALKADLEKWAETLNA
ncbi:interferon-induced, double-stranded RNA-activated protein kinase-like [Trachinotus anak]|uniref:interferon-induced, double-stranded RNA-activated protein kinase-like n=1 Tax=Trachinotus anak TaxID=443729 RepID=UPI0039F25119